MKKLIMRIERYLTNNERFNKSDYLYRKVYLLNAILTIMIITCLVFFFVDIIVFTMHEAAIVNAAGLVLALLILIYFKKTNDYKPAAFISVMVLIICLGFLFGHVQNKHYAFYWLTIVPPVVYFLLEQKAARLVLGLFGGYVLFFMLSNRGAWTPAEFDYQSVYNIIGASLCLVFMISYYERSRREALAVMKELNEQLDDNKNELRLILDSSAEAIYGLDLHGNCTFCNKSCISMLGYSDESELLGKNMHRQIHHSRSDKSPFPIEDCSIFKTFINGEGCHVEDEVFWRADGTSFEVEYYSYPQLKDGKIIGSVITFMDISDRKHKEEQIQYLYNYDILTGLKNRRCFEESRHEIDVPANIPLSVIFADINGLKMTNDIFGHAAGDELIKKSSEILQQVCRQNDIIVHHGGDEFLMLLPKTTGENAKKVLSRIKSEFTAAQIEAIKCSISLGLDTKEIPEQSLDEVMVNAENAMYKDKTMNRMGSNKDIIDAIIEKLHKRSPREKQHSENVSELCFKMGAALHLTETEISKLSRAAYLHDIGKIVLDKELLLKENYAREELEIMQQHSVVGYRILSLFDDTLDLAEYVYGHHERWGGAGYPRGLKGSQIPLLSRIIAIVETYERVFSRGELSKGNRKLAALEEIKKGAGTQFDPKIAGLFVKTMKSEEEKSQE